MRPEPLWRLSAWAYRKGHPRVARVLKALIYLLFRAMLPYECQMSTPPVLMHLGLGVVIHPTTRIGRGVTMGHGVTVAASPPDQDGVIHPVVIEDNAFIGAGAILIARGGPLRIGRHGVVGAGSVVLADVPDGGKVAGNPARPL